MPSNVGMRSGTELAGKVALVTGAARNIGRAIARSLAAGGAGVMVNARTSRAEAEKTVEMIGSNAALHIADVTKPDEVRALVDATVKRFGRLDFLVNNAAVRYETAFSAMSFQEWKEVLSIVLDGAFLCAQAALPHLIKAGGGTIVNIGGPDRAQGRFRARARHHGEGGPRGPDESARARPRAAPDHGQLRGAGHDREPARAAGCAGAAGAPARAAADRPARRAGGDRRHGAHAVRSRRALHHRSGDSRQWRRLSAVKEDVISPGDAAVERLHRRGPEEKPSPASTGKNKTPCARHHCCNGVRLAPSAREERHLLRQSARRHQRGLCNRQPYRHQRGQRCARQWNVRPRGRNRRFACAFGHAPGLRHRARNAGYGRARRQQRRCPAKAVALGYDVATRLTMSLNAFRFREEGSRPTAMVRHSARPRPRDRSPRSMSGRLDTFFPTRLSRHRASPAGCADEEHIEKAFDFGGMPARNGITAATMVAQGFSGVEDVFSGERNFFIAHGRPADPEALVRGLGEVYEILRTNIKRWSVGSPIQAPLDSLAILIKEHAMKADDGREARRPGGPSGQEHHRQPRHARYLHAAPVRGDAARWYRDVQVGAR